jgi:menaquinone-dependent protoporphyrinogen oxidase
MMKPILILYASREGQTERIAEYLGEKICSHALAATVLNAREVPENFSLTPYAAAVIAASVHGGKHEREIVKFIKNHRNALHQTLTAFVSVSLSQAGVQDERATPENREKAAADVKKMIDSFRAETQWHPTIVRPVAGALMYRQYNFILRLIMRRIARRAGASTDTSRDHVFTNWQDLDHFVDDLLHSLRVQPGAPYDPAVSEIA